MSWNWVDWILIIYILFSAARGLRVGLIRSVLGLAGILAGVIVAYFYSPVVVEWLESRFGVIGSIGASLEGVTELPIPLPIPPEGGEAVAATLVHGLVFAGLILAVAGLFAVVARAIAGGAQYVGLGFVDNILGMGFGAVKSLAIAAVVLGLAISFFQMVRIDWGLASMAESAFAPGLIRLFFAVSPWSPGS